VNQSHMSNG
jgi:hypothetical protein